MVLAMFLEKGLLMPFMEEETEVHREPKMLVSPRLARIKSVLTAIWVLSISVQPELRLPSLIPSPSLPLTMLLAWPNL